MSEAGFAQIIRTLLRKKVEKLISEEIVVWSENQRSHHVSYRLPFSNENLLGIHPRWNPYTIDVFINEEQLDPDIGELIIEEFSNLLHNNGFNSLIVSRGSNITFFKGTNDGSKLVADILMQFGPVETFDKITLQNTHHEFQIVPNLTEFTVDIKDFTEGRIIPLKTPQQAEAWIRQIVENDEYIEEKMNNVKAELYDKGTFFWVKVGLRPFNRHSFTARLGDKYIRSEKSVDHLFRLIHRRVNKFNSET